MKRAPRSANLVILENSDVIAAEIEAIQSRIRQRAFEISQTRPEDAHAIYDWMMAESEIISVPPVELTEKDGRFEVKFALAGANPNDVNVMVTPDQVLLKSQTTHEHDSGAGTVHVCDFQSSTTFRSVNLPEPVDLNSVKVGFADGIVTVAAIKKGAESPEPRKAAAPRRAPAKKSRARMA